MPIDPASMAMLEMHALNGAQRTADGASNGAEAMRLDYLDLRGGSGAIHHLF